MNTEDQQRLQAFRRRTVEVLEQTQALLVAIEQEGGHVELREATELLKRRLEETVAFLDLALS